MSDQFYIIIMIIIFVIIIFGENFVKLFTKNERHVIFEEKKALKISEELKRHIGSMVKIKFKSNFNIVALTYGQNNPVKIIAVDNIWVEVEFTYKKKLKRIIFPIAVIDNIETSR